MTSKGTSAAKWQGQLRIAENCQMSRIVEQPKISIATESS